MAEMDQTADVKEDLNKYIMAFKFFDKDDKGKISVEQLANVVYNSVGAKITESEVKDIAKEMQADEDGFISFEGFMKALQKQELSGVDVANDMERLGSLFQAMDKDGDGVVTASDWQSVLANLGLKMSEEEVHEVLRRAGHTKSEAEECTESEGEEEDEYTTTEEEEVCSGSEEDTNAEVFGEEISVEAEIPPEDENVPSKQDAPK